MPNLHILRHQGYGFDKKNDNFDNSWQIRELANLVLGPAVGLLQASEIPAASSGLPDSRGACKSPSGLNTALSFAGSVARLGGGFAPLCGTPSYLRFADSLRNMLLWCCKPRGH